MNSSTLRQRRAVNGEEHDLMSMEEIADRLGISRARVWQILQSAERKLRDALRSEVGLKPLKPLIKIERSK